MIVSEQSPTKTYAYSGPGVYAFPFQVTTETDVRVRYTDANGVVTDLGYLADYSVTLVAGGDSGGSISNTTNLGTGGSLLIYRHLPLTQLTDWVNAGPIDMEVLENDFDRITLILQQMNSTLTKELSVVNWKGSWTTGVAYEADNVVQTADYNLYACVVVHTAGATFAGDLSKGYWRLAADLSVVVTSATNAATSETNAATSETNAANSETNAANSATLAQQAIADSHVLAGGSGIDVVNSGTSPITTTMSLATGSDEASNSVDWNSVDAAKAGCSRYLITGDSPNGPGGSGHYYPFTFEHVHKNGSGDMTQFAIGYGRDRMLMRHRIGGVWSEWAKHIITAPVSENEGSQIDFDAAPNSGLSSMAIDVYGVSASVNNFRMLQRAADNSRRTLTFPAVDGTAWTSGNDGAGSGLDADKLDGLQGSSYLLKSGGSMSGDISFAASTGQGVRIGGEPVLWENGGQLQFGPNNANKSLAIQGHWHTYLVDNAASGWTGMELFANTDGYFRPLTNNFFYLGTGSKAFKEVNSYSYVTASDERLKDISDLGDTSWIYDLEPIAYTWKDKPTGTRYGFGAQTTYNLMPDKTANLVDKPDKSEDPWGMQPDQLIPLLLNETKILRQRIEKLEAQVRQ